MRSIANTPCNHISKQFSRFYDGLTNQFVRPESEALEFYQLNHALALVAKRRHKLEPLPDAELQLVERYFEVASEQAQRALYYLLLITCRETRHHGSPSAALTKAMTKEYGLTATKWVGKNFADSQSEAIHKWRFSPPDCTIGQLVGAVRKIFYYGSWPNKSYGGTRWGQVTDCLLFFINGQYSLAMMLDTVWTLCHNNGPIFNKGMLYASHDSIYEFTAILDAQRAGMIPSLIASPDIGAKYITPSITAANKAIFTLFPDLPKCVDWDVVEQLGSKQNYANLKLDSALTHLNLGESPTNTKPVGESFLVHPGLQLLVSKIERDA